MSPLDIRSLGDAAGVDGDPSIRREPWGVTGSGVPVELVTLTNGSGTTASVATYGATLVRLTFGGARRVPRTPPADMVLGFDSLGGYLASQPYLGATIGRYANRIANGVFILEGVRHRLSRNEGVNSLHGGAVGFDKAVWKIASTREDAVVLSHVSPDGDQGYPGTLTCVVQYELTEDDVLRISYDATTDRPTILNLTNHSYFNLGGTSGRDILEHRLSLDADRFLPVTSALIPTGVMSRVDGTPFDFRRPTSIAERLRSAASAGPHWREQIQNAGGFDHCFVVNGRAGTLRRAAVLTDPATERRMEVYTTSPGVQLYTGNRLDGTIRGRGRVAYGKHHALCLETQRFPDAPNQPAFPSTVLRPDERFTALTEYRFFGDWG